jgi:hypothetical protein
MRCAAWLSLDGADANVVAEAAPAIAERRTFFSGRRRPVIDRRQK